eukprot:CAMPEP_0171486526 /NCGR_PEP_ID=MMETSP0958-20121227/1140_1 /TAXON_ID=87120 /ORGANISM="Aurantiochytrium limacinum, Strain ATCCMYA-1381" /LENGTH=30 /DNA_ID= /DNA_START= /DNA_END= /DNA_ORIENTATION=
MGGMGPINGVCIARTWGPPKPCIPTGDTGA